MAIVLFDALVLIALIGDFVFMYIHEVVPMRILDPEPAMHLHEQISVAGLHPLGHFLRRDDGVYGVIHGKEGLKVVWEIARQGELLFVCTLMTQ
jgi:hypothetical protein